VKYYLCLTIHPRYEDTRDYRYFLIRESEEGLEGNFLGPGTRLLITASPDANLDGAAAIERTGCRRFPVRDNEGRHTGDLIIVDGYIPLEQVKPIVDPDGLAFLHRCLTKFGFKREEHVPPWPFRAMLLQIAATKRTTTKSGA
jgi:hypothetical protein